MTLRKRIDRLDRGKAPSHEAPMRIVLYGICPEAREAVTAAIMGGGSLTREDGETVEAFTARAEAGATGAVFLPDNGRDALATGKAPL